MVQYAGFRVHQQISEKSCTEKKKWKFCSSLELKTFTVASFLGGGGGIVCTGGKGNYVSSFDKLC